MLKKIINSFKNAFCGIFSAVSGERHMRVHIIAAAYVLWFSKFYDFTKTEYAILLFVIALVIVTEMINTAVEEVVDLASPSYHKKAKKSKDVAAGAVLISAFFAVIIGVLFFGNTDAFYNIINYFKSSLIKFVIFILSIVFSIFFVFVFFKSKDTHSQISNKEKQ